MPVIGSYAERVRAGAPGRKTAAQSAQKKPRKIPHLDSFLINNMASCQPLGGVNSLVREVGKTPIAVLAPDCGSTHQAEAVSAAVMAASLTFTEDLSVK
jgi:hypothetical protein